MKIFFDLDGTLIDVSERHHRVYSATVDDFDGTPLDKDNYWHLKRQKKPWKELLPLSDLDAGIEQDFLSKFIERIESVDYLKLDTLIDGATETLDHLSDKYECYLVSLRRNRDNLLQEIEWLGLAPHFKEILTGHSETDGYDKKIELISSFLDSSRGLIIGDTEADIVTGQKLGMNTVAVKSGIRDENFLSAMQPDAMLESVKDLGDYMSSLPG